MHIEAVIQIDKEEVLIITEQAFITVNIGSVPKVKAISR